MDIHSELINYVISEFQDFKYEPKSKPLYKEHFGQRIAICKLTKNYFIYFL